MTSRIDAFLEDARRHLDRVQPEDLPNELTLGALLVDIRPEHNREAEGVIPGAVVIDRNVLEWRLDPTSPDSIQSAEGRRIVVFCNDGYASSLAARTLQLLGLEDATDLEGGYRAWKRHLDAVQVDVPGGSNDHEDR
jgi:rhodanese-related sulfurtransferase